MHCSHQQYFTDTAQHRTEGHSTGQHRTEGHSTHPLEPRTSLCTADRIRHLLHVTLRKSTALCHACVNSKAMFCITYDLNLRIPLYLHARSGVQCEQSHLKECHDDGIHSDVERARHAAGSAYPQHRPHFPVCRQMSSSIKTPKHLKIASHTNRHTQIDTHK